MAGPRHGESGWFWSMAAILLAPAIVAGLAVRSCGERRNSFAALSETSHKEIAALSVTPALSAAVEQGWVRTDFKARELIAPLGPEPCPPATNALPLKQRSDAREAFAARDVDDADERIRRLTAIAHRDPTNLLVALIVGRELAEIGGYVKEAEEVMVKSLASTDEDTKLTRAAYAPDSKLDVNSEAVATVIHLHHTMGVAQLSSSAANPPWVALKNVIGFVLMLSRRVPLGLIPGESPARKLTIYAPGCPRLKGQALFSYDLYNNLIVAYARGGYGRKELRWRDREFHRDGKHNPSAVRKMFLALVLHQQPNVQPNESKLWALSNADAVLDERMPDDPRLLYNIVRVLDWWTDEEKQRCPAEICTKKLRDDLSKQRDILLNEALTHKEDVDDDQRAAFAEGMIRMLVDSNIPPASIPEPLTALKEWLQPDDQHVVDDLLAAEKAREALPRWVVRGDAALAAPPPWEPLGRNAAAWRKAALEDFANNVAVWATDRSEHERKQTVAAIRRLLEPSVPPPAVTDLLPTGADRVWFDLWTTRWAWISLGVATGALLWLFFVWVLLQIREYRLLQKSFYDMELEYIDNIDVPRRR